MREEGWPKHRSHPRIEFGRSGRNIQGQVQELSSNNAMEFGWSETESSRIGIQTEVTRHRRVHDSRIKAQKKRQHTESRWLLSYLPLRQANHLWWRAHHIRKTGDRLRQSGKCLPRCHRSAMRKDQAGSKEMAIHLEHLHPTAPQHRSSDQLPPRHHSHQRSMHHLRRLQCPFSNMGPTRTKRQPWRGSHRLANGSQPHIVKRRTTNTH